MIFVFDWWVLVTVVGMIKLALEAGKATPAPPVGPALGSKGVNIMAFCKDYNARTADKAGYVIPVEITVYDVSLFSYLLSFLLVHFEPLLIVDCVSAILMFLGL